MSHHPCRTISFTNTDDVQKISSLTLSNTASCCFSVAVTWSICDKSSCNQTTCCQNTFRGVFFKSLYQRITQNSWHADSKEIGNWKRDVLSLRVSYTPSAIFSRSEFSLNKQDLKNAFNLKLRGNSKWKTFGTFKPNQQL